MKKITMALGLALLLACAASCKETTVEAIAPDAKEFKVEIGKSASEAEKALSHNITHQALKEGQKEYAVEAAGGHSYKVSLNEKEIEDILAGTTVIVQSGEMKVKIGPAKKAKKKSGW